LLPRHAQTSANGRFELALPQIPDDLQGTARLTARISAVDPAGDRVEGTAAVLLSKDAIAVSAVTELGDGLVESFNNRLYVRVTTPDGRVVANTKVTVKRAWQPHDRGMEAELDEDGVASLQLDPGAPVNIVIPPPPWRPFEPIEELTDRFYLVLAELHAQVHAWETQAPPAEKMTPATLARLWQAALEACRARGERVDDAYGRTLRLSRLPPDLLSLTDPRAVVVVATRLPEDVDNWPAWVAKEKP